MILTFHFAHDDDFSLFIENEKSCKLILLTVIESWDSLSVCARERSLKIAKLNSNVDIAAVAMERETLNIYSSHWGWRLTLCCDVLCDKQVDMCEQRRYINGRFMQIIVWCCVIKTIICLSNLNLFSSSSDTHVWSDVDLLGNLVTLCHDFAALVSPIICQSSSELV